MTKSSRKKTRSAARKAAGERRRQEIWTPSLPPEDLAHFKYVTDAMRAELKRVSRPASCAHTRYGVERSRSHIGGTALRRPQSWPTKNGNPLSLVAEIFINDLPFCPPVLNRIKLLQLYLELTPASDTEPEYPFEGAWHVQSYERIDHLVEHSDGLVLDKTLLSWDYADTTPSYPDNLSIINQDLEDAFEDLPNSVELYADMDASGFGGNMVGGWPTWLNGGDTDTYVMQLEGSEIGIDLGLDGMIFIGLKDGKWWLLHEIG